MSLLLTTMAGLIVEIDQRAEKSPAVSLYQRELFAKLTDTVGLVEACSLVLKVHDATTWSKEQPLPEGVKAPPEGFIYVGKPFKSGFAPTTWLCWDTNLDEGQAWDIRSSVTIDHVGWPFDIESFIFACPKSELP